LVLPVGSPPEHDCSAVVPTLTEVRVVACLLAVRTRTLERLQHQIAHAHRLAADRDAGVAVLVRRRCQRRAASGAAVTERPVDAAHASLAADLVAGSAAHLPPALPAARYLFFGLLPRPRILSSLPPLSLPISFTSLPLSPLPLPMLVTSFHLIH